MFQMTPNILRNLVGRKATRRYPAEQRAPFKGSRGELVNDPEKCTLCGVCALKCPSQCISVDKDTGTWHWDPFACLFCGVCVEACQAQSLGQTVHYHKPVKAHQTISFQKVTHPRTTTRS